MGSQQQSHGTLAVLNSQLDEAGVLYVRHSEKLVELAIAASPVEGTDVEPAFSGASIHCTSDSRAYLSSTASSTFRVPEFARRTVASLLVHLNWSLTTGCVEMDPRDGELRFRSAAALNQDASPAAIASRQLTDCTWKRLVSSSSTNFHRIQIALQTLIRTFGDDLSLMGEAHFAQIVGVLQAAADDDEAVPESDGEDSAGGGEGAAGDEEEAD